MHDRCVQPAAGVLCPDLDTGLPEIENYLYKIQSKAVRRIKGLENIICEDKLKKLMWFS